MLTLHQEQMLYDTVHNVCKRCNLDFLTYDALMLHLTTSRKHHYCEMCDNDFADKEMLVLHLRELHDLYCVTCDSVLRSFRELDRHNRQVHFYCLQCGTSFVNQNRLRQHLRSTGHKSVHCPGKECHKVFTSGADLVCHLESGACRSGVTRQKINRAAAKHDTQHVVTIPSRMLAYTQDDTQPSLVATLATELSWNGQAYECFLCHREFRTLKALNQHLASPVHEEKMYRCPLGYAGCGAEFKALSALCQHVESGTCGIRRFNSQMQDYLGNLTNNMRRLGI